MADITNNPFIDHSSSVTSRFPSLAERNDSQSPPAHPQYISWLQGQSSGPSYSNPNQGYAASNPTGYGGVQGYQQQQQPTGFGAAQYGAQQTGYGQPPTSPTASGFRPSSSFGQQMISQPGYSTGYAQQQQPQQPQYTGYPQTQTQTGYGGYGQGGYGQQQQAQQPTPYGGNPTLAAFDPYSTLSSPNFQPGSASAPTSPASSVAPGAGGYRADHPRAFIQAHKAELEKWDAVTWKQALNSFDALKGAWDTRKREVEARVKVMGGTVGSAGGFFGGGQAGYGGYGYGQQWQQQQQAQEFERLNALYKEAESNVDSVAASYFQMNEVFTGYRHSGDLASKRRVRESCNAALTNLPDWPPQSF